MMGPQQPPIVRVSSRIARTGLGLLVSTALLVAAVGGIPSCADSNRYGPSFPAVSARPPRTAPAARLPPDGFVDRVEGDLAVIVTEDDRVVHWPCGELREGDVLRGGRPDPVARAELRARVEDLRSRLGEGDDSREDLDL